MAQIQNSTQYNALLERLKSGEFDDQPGVKANLTQVAASYASEHESNRRIGMMDLSPKERFTPSTAAYMGPGFTSEEVNKSGVIQNELSAMADAGIDVTSGSDDLWLRTTTGLLGEEATLIGDGPDAEKGERPEGVSAALIDYRIRRGLKDQGYDIPLDMPVTYNVNGRAVFLRPDQETGKLVPTLFDEAGLTFEDVAEVAGDALTIGAEILGSVGGAAAGTATAGPVGTFVGAAAGAGAGAAGARVVRTAVARAMGVPEEIADKIGSDEALEDALWAAGGEGAAATGLLMYRGGRQLIGKGTLELVPGQTIEALAEQLKEGMKAQQKLTKATRKAGKADLEFNYGIGRTTGEATMLQAEGEVMSKTSGKPGQKLKAQEIQHEQNLAEAVRRINEKAVPGLDGKPSSRIINVQDPERPGQFIQKEVSDLLPADDAQRVMGKELAGVDEAVDVAEDKLLQRAIENDALELQLDQVDKIRGKVAEAGVLAKEQERTLWQQFRTNIGWDPEKHVSKVRLINAPDSPINRALAEIGDAGKAAYAKEYADSAEGLLKNLDDLKRGDLDPQQLHVVQSYLKQQLRMKAAARKAGGPDPVQWSTGDLLKMNEAIDTMMVKGGAPLGIAMPNGGFARAKPHFDATVRESYETASRASLDYHQRYRNQFIKDILEMRSGKLKDGTAKFEKTKDALHAAIFKAKDSGPLRDVLDALGGDVFSRQQMLESFETFYKRIMRQGTPDMGTARSRHQQFMDQYQQHIELLAGKGSMPDEIADFGQLQKVLFTKKVEAEMLRKKLGDTLGTLLDDKTVGPANLVERMLSGKVSPEQLRNARTLLIRADPNMWRAIQAKGMDFIEDTLLKSSQMLADGDKTMKLLRENRTKLAMIYGGNYVKDLDTLVDVMRIHARGRWAVAAGSEVQPSWLQITRSIMGPLSKKQRFLTAMNRYRNKHGLFMLRKLATDPTDLSAFVKLKKLDAGSYGRVNVMLQLGLLPFGVEQDQRTAAFMARGQGLSLSQLQARKRAEYEQSKLEPTQQGGPGVAGPTP